MPFTPFTGIDTLLTVPVNLQGAAGPNPVFGAGSIGDTFNEVELRANGVIAFGTGAGAPTTTISRPTGSTISVNQGPLKLANGSLDVAAAGQGLQVAEGANAKQGTAVLVAGTVTVANTSVTVNSKIFLSRSTAGGTLGHLSYTISAGVSFTINSTSATDTSTINYEIMEPG